MDRRNFLKYSGATTTALLGPGLGSAHSADESGNAAASSTKQSRKSVIVAGGGIAGLSTAYELMKRGYEVTVLEA